MQRLSRRAGRPSAPVLSRELIVATALRLLDERGEDGIGMRDIAHELGVRASALYNHVSGKEDIIDGIRELVSDRFDMVAFETLPWDEALEHWARSYLHSFVAHPPTIAMLAVRPLAPQSRTAHMYDTVCATLISAGWPEERVLPVMISLESFILGSALDYLAPPDMLNPGDSEALSSLRAAYRARETSRNNTPPSELAFEQGLQTLMSGLRAQFAELRGAGDPPR